MHSIKKRLPSYPFAHRQWKHKGHCSLIHGHNWIFELELESKTLDDNYFVFDFADFKPLRAVLDGLFDHTLVLSEDDPLIMEFDRRANIFNLKVIPHASCEGIAECIFNIVKNMFADIPLKSVSVFEDEKNSATYCA